MATTCYKEPYLPGSFKLVPFKAIEVSSEHGRRGAEGEFPFSERTAYADLGRRIRTYSISARFDSNHHVLEAAALIAVVEAPGPGPLVHPTRGIITSAACRSLSVRDEVEEGQGVTYVDMEFVEANLWPNGLSLVSQLLGLTVAPVIGSSEASFNSAYRMDAVPVFRETEVVSAAQGQIENISVEYAKATTSKADDEKRNRIIFDLTSTASSEGLARSTDIASRALTYGMAAIASDLTGVDQFDTFRELANGAAKTSSLSGGAGQAENAVYSHVRTVAAAYMAQGLLEAENLTTGAIFERLDMVSEILEQEASYARQTCDNQLYISITDFRTEALAQGARRAYDSPGLVEYNFGGSVHPLVAAYAIFNNATRFQELIDLNGIGRFGRLRKDVVAQR